MATSDEIIDQARTYKGVKWRHQGRNRSTGIDCVGLIAMVAKDLKISDYDFTSYQRRANGDEFLTHFRSNLPEVHVNDIEPGDVLVFADSKYQCHAGIMSYKHGRPHFIHSFAGTRKVVEQELCKKWLEKLTHAFKFMSKY